MSEKSSTIIPRKFYSGNGEKNCFEIPFMIFDTKDIKVYIDNLPQTSGYTITIDKNKNGGQITFDTAPPSNSKIAIIRKLAYHRVTDFPESAPIRKTTLNYELNYSAACIQQLGDQLDNAMLIPPYIDNFNLTLPPPTPNKGLVWNEEGTALVNTNIDITNFDNELKNAVDISVTSKDITIAQTEIATQAANYVRDNLQLFEDTLGNKLNLNFDNISDTGFNRLIEALSPDFDHTLTLNVGDIIPDYGYLLTSGNPMGSGTHICLRIINPLIPGQSLQCGGYALWPYGYSTNAIKGWKVDCIGAQQNIFIPFKGVTSC